MSIRITYTNVDMYTYIAYTYVFICARVRSHKGHAPSHAFTVVNSPVEGSVKLNGGASGPLGFSLKDFRPFRWFFGGLRRLRLGSFKGLGARGARGVQGLKVFCGEGRLRSASSLQVRSTSTESPQEGRDNNLQVQGTGVLGSLEQVELLECFGKSSSW